MNRTMRTLVVYGLSIILVAVLAQWWFDQVSGPEEVSALGVHGTGRGRRLRRGPDAGPFQPGPGAGPKPETTPPMTSGTSSPATRRDSKARSPRRHSWTGTSPSGPTPSRPAFWELLISFLPWLFLLGFMVFIFMQMQGGGNRVMQFGKSRAKLVGKEQPKVTFDDVAGLEEAKEELEEIKDFLANPDRYRQMGAKIPKGVLLFGPPGTGKTLLAKAVAGEAGVPFLSISGSDFVEMFVGVGAARVRDLFEQAKNERPGDRLHRRDRRRRPSSWRRSRRRPRRAGADPQPAAGRAGRLRGEHRGDRDGRPPTGPTSSTRPCSDRDGSTVRSSSTLPTSTAARRSWRCTPRASRSPRRSISRCWPDGPLASPGPTWPT